MLLFFDLKDIAEQGMEILNPSSPAKIVEVGRTAGLKPGQQVIDFGCGFGEALALWGETYGIGGVGIDVRPKACDRARVKMSARGLSDRVEIVCQSGADYAFEKGAFDVASCIGATFIWGDYRAAVRAMREAIRPGGRLVIGEVFWLTAQVPPDLAKREGFLTEKAILDTSREEGFDVLDVVRASVDDWDRYESDNWMGLIRWLEDNPQHPDRQQVLDTLRASQDEYFTVGRQYFGWAMFVLLPKLS